MCVIDFASFCNFSILFLKGLDRVVFFVSHLRVTYIQYSTHKKYIDHLSTCLTCLKRQLWTCLWYGAFDFCKACYNNKLKSLFFSFFLAHLAFRPCELLPSLFVRRPSVNISHFNLLLRNHWANCNQTLVEWSLGGPPWKLCPVIPTSNQDGRQAKSRIKWGWN